VPWPPPKGDRPPRKEESNKQEPKDEGGPLTDQQKAQVKAILRKYQPTAGPLIHQVVTERRALRDAIRAQAAKTASLEADLALQRAVLTPEQIQKLKEMQIDADARFDGWLQRIANRIAIIDHGRLITSGTAEQLKNQTGAASLEDAFLKLTGTVIRDEEASATDHMRMRRRAWGGRK
jgi:hypothetical protein